ncbi:sister chromatid cohesion 1 protein 4 isoform X22 [Lathyrus oleraceus]|uniref:sister chromatid cohesion 1 protein 4 isoform X22 n=1 Tax=Pisum sativum TaxID=3888 RepID=UPI0021D0443B|nr:sister chromatid cohesion 1 protein 4 isoform X22 [Pisum sativum]
MFYSQFILAKKGPLGTIWIAAHLERKLRKNQVADTDIGVSVDSILFPEVPIALRLSSHLLLGVVRIYSRKVNYLFDDCSEALLKVKQAFRSTAVDLPPEESTAPYHSITLPETFDLDDFELPDNDIFQGNYVDRHVSTREQITLQDTLDGMAYKTTQFGLDERFGDGDASQIGLDLDEVMLIDKDSTLEHNDFSANPQVSRQEDEKKEDVVTTSDKMLVEDSGSKVMLIDQDANLEPDDLGANSQISHHKDEKKEDVIGTSNRMQVEDSGSKIDLSDGFPTSPEFHEYAQGLSTSPEFHDYAQDPSTSPEFHNCAQDPSVSPEFHEYAQGPSTPGLQEPNLFGTQSDQVINEADFHNSADLLSMYSTQNESRAHQTENNVIGCSLQNNGKHVGVDLHHEASDCVLADVNNKREEQEHFTRTVVMKDQGNLIPNNNCLASVPLMDSSNEDHTTTVLPECAGGYVDTSGILEKVERLHDGVLMNTESVMANLNETVNVVSGGVNINDSGVSPSCSHVTSDQEGLSCKLLSNMDESRGSEFGGHLADVTTLLKHGVSNNSEVSKNEQQPSVAYEAQVSNIVSPLESSGRPEVVDVEARASQELKEAGILNFVSHEAEQPTQSHLRPCTSRVNNPSLLSIEGEKCHETDVSDPALGYHGTVEPSACEGKLDLGQSGMQFGSQIISNKMGSVNTFTASDIPEPEKMLSLGQSGMQFGNQMISNKMGSVNTFTATDIPEPEKMLSLGQSGMQFGNQMISHKMGSINTFTATDIPAPEKMLSLGQSGMQFGSQMISNKMGSANPFTASDIPAPEKMLSLGQSSMQFGNQMISNKMGSVNTFTASNIPEPEKMLSLGQSSMQFGNQMISNKMGSVNTFTASEIPVPEKMLSLGQSDMQYGSQMIGNKMGSVNAFTASDIPAPEKMLSLGQSDMQYGSQMIGNKMGSVNTFTASNIPEPEKMLSLAYPHFGEMNHLLLESTPGNQVISGGHRDVAAVTSISGQKRSYTESTLTLQSMGLVESYGGAQSRRTTGSIPDDNDLLSSILAGRKSSALKVKPSPATAEVPTAKRFRSTPRTSTLKRKVLVDDTMVLHGDTIRHQLISTEDIRRVRKKAPCTSDEILMIQRQVLEDKIFHKPIFTDLSADLTILQNGAFDLSGIKVYDYGLDGFSVEKVNNQQSYSKSNAEIHVGQAHNEPMAVQPQEEAEESYSKTNVGIHEVESHNEPMEVQLQNNAEAQPSEMPVPSERESHNETMEVQPQITAEAQPSEMPVPSEREPHNETMEVQPQITAEARPSEMPVPSERESHNETMEVQPQITAEAQPSEMPVPSERESHNETMEVQPQITAEAQPSEIPLQLESDQSGVDFGSHDIDAHGRANIISNMKELSGSQNAEMNNAGGIFEISETENYSVGPTNIISDVNELGSSQNAEMNNAGRIFETSEAENYSIVHSNIISDVNELGGSQNAEMNNAGRNFETSEAENYSIVHSNIISDGNELGSSQNAEMSNSGGNFETFESENYSVVPGHETLSLTEVFENELCMPKDFDASQPLMDKTDDGAGSIQTNVLEIPTSEKMNTSTILENEFVDDQHDRNNADAIEIAEHDMEIGTRVETDGLEADNLHASLVLGSKEASEYTDNQVSFHGDLPMEENGNNMLEGLNEDLVVSSGLGCDDKDAKAGGLFSENIEVDCLHSVAPEDVKEGSNDEENSVFQEAALQNTMYPDVSAIRSPSVDQNDEDDMVDNDTGFLNVGDDEIIDDDDDDADGFAPGAEGTQLENSGWSSRTRAVAKYLQTLFDKEDLHGRQSLHLDKILVGKTRKEASRMFFETLVLKTRDYIDVEQTKPFANINLQPRGKLMKTDF